VAWLPLCQWHQATVSGVLQKQKIALGQNLANNVLLVVPTHCANGTNSRCAEESELLWQWHLLLYRWDSELALHCVSSTFSTLCFRSVTLSSGTAKESEHSLPSTPEPSRPSHVLKLLTRLSISSIKRKVTSVFPVQEGSLEWHPLHCGVQPGMKGGGALTQTSAKCSAIVCYRRGGVEITSGYFGRWGLSCSSGR
jgi:hypothetical protein